MATAKPLVHMRRTRAACVCIIRYNDVVNNRFFNRPAAVFKRLNKYARIRERVRVCKRCDRVTADARARERERRGLVLKNVCPPRRRIAVHASSLRMRFFKLMTIQERRRRSCAVRAGFV